MFTIEQRDHVRERVVALAQADPRVTAGALTGSTAVGAEDRWSDIDVAFGITDGISLDAVLQDWTTMLDQEFDVLAHFDLPAGAAIYRVFLLPSGLEIDVGVTPGQEFGAKGPRFRTLFGTTRQLKAAARMRDMPQNNQETTTSGIAEQVPAAPNIHLTETSDRRMVSLATH